MVEDSPAHNNNKKCMAFPAMACNEDDNLVDRGNNEGNGSGVDDDDNVLVGARWRR